MSDCKCKEWASDDLQADLCGNGHHHHCSEYRPNVGAVDLIRRLVSGMSAWASDEDGVHPDAFAAYRDGHFLVHGSFPPEREA